MGDLTPFPAKFSLANRTVVITGAGRGLGFSFARCLAEAGANVAAIDLHEKPEELQDLIKSGLNVRYFRYCPTPSWLANCRLTRYRCDVRDRPHLKEIIDQIARDFGSIHGW